MQNLYLHYKIYKLTGHYRFYAMPAFSELIEKMFTNLKELKIKRVEQRKVLIHIHDYFIFKIEFEVFEQFVIDYFSDYHKIKLNIK